MRVLLLSIFFAHLLLVPASAVDHDMIEAPGPHGPLKGTFLSPVGENIPLVLIIPGSGPTDRDGNSPLGIKASTYRLIAEGLKENGIASVRFDKRGMFASAAAVPDANAVTIDDYANDILLWIAAARQRTGNRCVWVLGHSEGGLVAEAVKLLQRDFTGRLPLRKTCWRPVLVEGELSELGRLV